MNEYQQNIMKRYQATNRIAFYHPRKKTISLNGGPELPINEAVSQMLDCLMREDKTHEKDPQKEAEMAWRFLERKKNYNS